MDSILTDTQMATKLTTLFLICASFAQAQWVAPFVIAPAAGGCAGVACDDFNRANEDPLGGDWTITLISGGNITLTSNAISGSGAQNQWAYRNAESYSNDQYCQMKYGTTVGAGDYGSIMVRAGANRNGYSFYIYDSGVHGVWYVTYGGTPTWEQIGTEVTISPALQTGDTEYMSISGYDLTFKINGTTVSTVTDPNSRLSTGVPGFNLYTTVSGIWDDFVGGDL